MSRSLNRAFFRDGTSRGRQLFTAEKAVFATFGRLLSVLRGCRVAHCVGLEKVHLEPLAAHHFLRSRARICLPYTPVQASCWPFFSKSPSAMFYCRDAPPRRLLDTHSWHSARGRCMAAFDTRCRCFSTHLLERGSAVQRGRRRRRVGSRVETAGGLFSILLLRPKAACMIRGSKIKEKPQM